MSLQSLHNSATLKQLDELFVHCANEIALQDMDNGRDVSYVPKNKAVWVRVKQQIKKLATEKQDTPPTPQRNL